MGISHFLIDGQKIPVEDAISGKVPTRFPIPYLELAADFRAWDGKPHVTDLLSGIRPLWLKNKNDYAVDPDDAAYRILGIGSHARLESSGDQPGAELPLDADEIQGRTDLLTTVNGKMSIIDYKVLGSYKVQQLLGIYYEDVPVLDPDGNPVFFKSGKNKGERKTKKMLKTDPSKADVKEFARQLNIYRYLVKLTKGVIVDDLYLFVIVRDGGTRSATERGVLFKTYTIRLPLAPEEKVIAYVEARSAEIRAYMASDNPPPMCTVEECWNGKKCQEYCEVKDFCAALGDNPFLRNNPEEKEADSAEESGD
ncbi:MAG TPA: hypothetical protein PLI66_05190 [Spirochaetales bacterium]|nr:hypothetical protein [Spirochaetales bacterium]